MQILTSVKDVFVGARACSLFDEYPDQNFFGAVTEHFAEENLWHVIYDDGDEEDMTDTEVLDAVNLARTLFAEDPNNSNHDTPTRTPVNQPATVPSSAEPPSPTADQERSMHEANLGEMLDEFDELCLEGEATDPKTRQSHDIQLDNDVSDKSQDVSDTGGIADDQCSWCGFRDHNRKTRASCPQHPNYNGTNHQKGDKIREDWVPGTRASHQSGGQRQKLTATSVRSKPLHASFKVKDWTVGVGALNTRSKFAPKEFTGRRLLTYPKTSLGWTVDTPPIDLVRQFYPACPLAPPVL